MARVAIVTGGTRGIGEAISIALRDQGMKVAAKYAGNEQRAREFSDRVLPLFDSGRLRPVIDRVFPFSAIREAHMAMEGNETFGKIVLKWD